MSGPVVGIDLGGSYSTMCLYTPQGVEIIPSKSDGTTLIPTYVTIIEDCVYTGTEAQDQGEKQPKNVIYETIRMLGKKPDETEVRDFKKKVTYRTMNINETVCIQIDGSDECKTYTIEEILTYFLKDCKKSIDAHIGIETTPKLVLTTAQNLNRLQTKLLNNAANTAGFEILKITTSSNTAGVAYAYQNHALETERKILIFDIGGCSTTANIYTIDGTILETVNTSCIPMGGEDFNRRILEYFVQEFNQLYNKDLKTHPAALARLKRHAEAAKIALSSKQSVTVQVDNILNNINYKSVLSRRQFEDICSDLFWDVLRPIQDVLSDSKMDKLTPKDVILIGGSSRIPKIQELVKEFFGRDLNFGLNSDDVASFGAALLCASLDSCEDDFVMDLLLIDSVSYPLGLETAGGIMTRVVEKNSFPPLSVSKTFTTFNDNEDVITMFIYEGSSTMTRYNVLLGTLTISGLPNLPRGVPKIEVTFEVTEDLVLRVSARELSTGHFGETIIKSVKNVKVDPEMVATQLVACR